MPHSSAVVGIADHILKNSLRRYIQNRISQRTKSTAAPCNKRLVRLADDCKRFLPQVDGQVPGDEALPETGHAVSRDRIHADDPERERPETHPR